MDKSMVSRGEAIPHSTRPDPIASILRAFCGGMQNVTPPGGLCWAQETRGFQKLGVDGSLTVYNSLPEETRVS